MIVLRVKENTEAWEIINKVFTYQLKWLEHKKEIEEFLGFEMHDVLYYDNSKLMLKPSAVKEEWKDQFKKDSYPAVAKSKSKINKEWIKLCKDLGLEVHEIHEFSIKYALIGLGCTYHSIDGNYYIEIKQREFDTSRYDWSEVISEADFLRVKADFVEKEEKEKVG